MLVTTLLAAVVPSLQTPAPAAAAGAAPAAAKAVQPAGRAGHALVFDTQRRVALLVNGDHVTNDKAPGDLAAWNGKSWTVLDPNAPGPRILAAVAFDTRRSCLVVQGGLGVGELVHGDTLEWDGAKWRTIADDGKGPGVRNHHAATFDAERGVVVLFAGQDRDLKPLGDTWEWNGAKWKQVATTGPAGRVHHALVHDPVRKQTLLFGGCNPSGDLADFWQWDGKAWQEIRAEGAPSARAACRMAFDAGKAEVVLFGGMDVEAGPFAWNGTSWRRDAREGAPTQLSHHAITYDTARKCIVMFGGYTDARAGTLMVDTWERDAAGHWRCAAKSAKGQ